VITVEERQAELQSAALLGEWRLAASRVAPSTALSALPYAAGLHLHCSKSLKSKLSKTVASRKPFQLRRRNKSAASDQAFYSRYKFIKITSTTYSTQPPFVNTSQIAATPQPTATAVAAATMASGDKEKKKEKKEKKEKKDKDKKRKRESEGAPIEQPAATPASHSKGKDAEKAHDTPAAAAVPPADASTKKKKRKSSAAADGGGSGCGTAAALMHSQCDFCVLLQQSDHHNQYHLPLSHTQGHRPQRQRQRAPSSAYL